MWYRIANKIPNLLLFLDIDGVLNKYPAYDKSEIHKDIKKIADYIEPECISNLNKIVELLHPTIILSSYWRKVGSIKEIEDILKSKGFKGKISDKTPESGKEHRERFKQIEKIINKYKPENYIILDDSAIDEDPDFKNPYWIKTNRETGLSSNDIDKILKLIKGQN